MDKFSHVDQFNFAIPIDFWCFVVGELVTESGNNGVIIRVTKGTEYVGYDEARELGVVVECPMFEEFPSFFFRFSVEVVAFFLG